MAPYQTAFTSTHTVTNIADQWAMAVGATVWTQTWSGQVQITPPPPQDMAVDMIINAGTNTGSEVGSASVPAGTSAAVPFGFVMPFPAGATALQMRVRATANWTSTPTITTNAQVTWGIPAPDICAYGTQKIQPTASIVEVGPGLLDALGIALAEPWAAAIILAHSAAVVSLEWLCSGPPQPPATVDAVDWTVKNPGDPFTVAEHKILNNFQNSLWHMFCT